MSTYRLVRMKRGEGDPRWHFAAVGGKNTPLGELELFFDDGIAVISDLYVAEEFRRQGVGTFLLQAVIDRIDEMEIFTPVELRFPRNAETEDLYAFLAAQGNFTMEETGSRFYTVTAANRRGLTRWQQMSQASSQAVEFFNLPEKQRQVFYEKLEEEEWVDVIDPDGSVYDKRLCFANVKDKQVVAAVFLEPLSDKAVEVSFLYADGHHPAALRDVLCAAVNAMDELYTGAELRFTVITPEVEGLVRGIFGEELGSVPVICASWDGLSQEGMEELGEILRRTDTSEEAV